MQRSKHDRGPACYGICCDRPHQESAAGQHLNILAMYLHLELAPSRIGILAVQVITDEVKRFAIFGSLFESLGQIVAIVEGTSASHAGKLFKIHSYVLLQ